MVTNNLYLEWLHKANDDELNVRSILKHRDGTPNGVCVFSQQMAEKYLKGFLVYLGIEFPNTHDIVELATLIRSTHPAIDELKEDGDYLSRLYVKIRYPSDTPDRSWEEAERALAAAERIKEFVLSKIN